MSNTHQVNQNGLFQPRHPSINVPTDIQMLAISAAAPFELKLRYRYLHGFLAFIYQKGTPDEWKYVSASPGRNCNLHICASVMLICDVDNYYV